MHLLFFNQTQIFQNFTKTDINSLFLRQMIKIPLITNRANHAASFDMLLDLL